MIGEMNYAIIGCGLIGKNGWPAAGSKLVVACDTNLPRAEELVKLAKTGRAVADFKEAVADPQVDAVIVATINSALRRSFRRRDSRRQTRACRKAGGHFREAD